MRWAWAAAAAGVMATGLGACDQRGSRPFSFGKTKPAATVAERGATSGARVAAAPSPVAPCETRPDWWHDVPRKQGNVLSVCAGAEDRDLLAARRRAVENATQRFAAAAGSPPVEPEMQADSVRQNDGTFRAFVRLWARVP